MEVVMSGNTLRVASIVISALLFFAAFVFGLKATEGACVAAAGPITGGFLAAGSLALIAAALTKPDK